MASNRFAALAPEFEEEEAKKKQAAEQKAKREVLKPKVEEKPHTERTERRQEGPQAGPEHYFRGSMERGRGRGRGMGMGRRARGGYSHAGAPQYVPKEKQGFRDDRDFHFTGDNNAVHPFDRKSGTGRGTEVSKAGAGTANWGRPEDDVKNIEKYPVEAVSPAAESHETEQPKEGAEAKPEDSKTAGRRERKTHDKRKGGRFEEKEKEPEFRSDENTLTLEEYRAKMAESLTGLPTKKAEVQIARDPKAAGLVAYAKPKLSGQSDIVAKKELPKQEKTTVVAASEPKAEILGTFIGYEESHHAFRDDRSEGERGHRGRGRGRGGRGFAAEQPREEKKPEPQRAAATFVMKAEEFPTF